MSLKDRHIFVPSRQRSKTDELLIIQRNVYLHRKRDTSIKNHSTIEFHNCAILFFKKGSSDLFTSIDIILSEFENSLLLVINGTSIAFFI